MNGRKVKRHKLVDRGLDRYETPPEATRALMESDPFFRDWRLMWEPCCASGKIVSELRRDGHGVVASDIEPVLDHAYTVDFLLPQLVFHDIEAIVTNPPYKHANEFVHMARAVAPVVFMLLPVNFLASDSRTSILELGDYVGAYVFRNRLPMMHRDGWAGEESTSQENFAWFKWDRSHNGADPWTKRISWRPLTEDRTSRR